MMLQERSIGIKIAEARKKQNLSQAELGRLISISPQAVGKWERGESMPDITTLNRLAEILGVDLNYFSENFPSIIDQHPTEQLAPLTDSPLIRIKKKLNRNMSAGNWVDADFSGIRDLQEKFSGSNMKNCLFRNADLSGLTLASNNIDKCDFTGTDLRDSSIRSSNLMLNNFSSCSLIDTQFVRNNIGSCNFTETNFSGAEFTSCNFEKNNLSGAVWKFTTFKNCAFSEIIFEGPMADCHFENCSFYHVTFQTALLINTFFKYNRRFKKVKFIDCKVDSLTYAFLKNNQADLSGVVVV